MSSTEDTPSAAHWSAELSRKLSAQRTRMRGAVDAQRERLRELETTLEQRFGVIRSSIEQATQTAESRHANSSAKLAELKREEERLIQRNAELLRHREELETLHGSLEETQHTAADRERNFMEDVSRQMHELRQRELALAKVQREVSSTQQQAENLKRVGEEQQTLLLAAEQDLQSREEELRNLEVTLHRKHLDIETRQERTRRQRIALARDLRSRRKEMLAELEHQRHLQESEIQHNASQQANAHPARHEDDSLAAADKTKLTLRLADMQELLAVAQNQFAAEHQARLQLESQLRDQASAAHGKALDLSAIADLQTRLDMALAELREEKKRGQALREQAANKPATVVKTAVANNALDWATRKQNLLAQLEDDYSEQNPEEKAEKLSLQNIIEQTDEAIALKDAEVQELRQELAEQTSQVGRLNLGAAALSELLDKDERVLQERENLRALQEKVREQFKQAEVEISMERARLARERLELEEKIQRLEKQRDAPSTNDHWTPTERSKSEKAGGNASLSSRWLTRFGLKDDKK